MLLLLLLVLLTVSISSYDLVEYKKMHFFDAKNDGSVEKQNHCTVEDYNFFDKKA